MTTSYESVPIIFLAVETSCWVWPVCGVITLNPFCSLSFPCQPWTSAYVPRQTEREVGTLAQLRLAPHRCSGTWPPSPRSCSAPTGRSAPRTWLLLWLWRCCCLCWRWWWLLRSSQLTVAAQHQPSQPGPSTAHWLSSASILTFSCTPVRTLAQMCR